MTKDITRPEPNLDGNGCSLQVDKTLRRTLRARLESVAEQAVQATKFGPHDDRLLDLVDSIDADIQDLIALINSARREEAR